MSYRYCIRDDNGELGFTAAATHVAEDYKDYDLANGSTYVSKGFEVVHFKDCAAVVSDTIHVTDHDDNIKWHEVAVDAPAQVLPGSMGWRSVPKLDGYVFDNEIEVEIETGAFIIGGKTARAKVITEAEFNTAAIPDSTGGMVHVKIGDEVLHLLPYNAVKDPELANLPESGSAGLLISDLISTNSKNYRAVDMNYWYGPSAPLCKIKAAPGLGNLQTITVNSGRWVVRKAAPWVILSSLTWSGRRPFMFLRHNDDTVWGPRLYADFTRTNKLNLAGDMLDLKCKIRAMFRKAKAATKGNDLTLSTRPGNRYCVFTYNETVTVEVRQTNAQPLLSYI